MIGIVISFFVGAFVGASLLTLWALAAANKHDEE